MNKSVMLGSAAKTDVGIGSIKKPKTIEERLAVLESEMVLVSRLLPSSRTHESAEESETSANKDGIPYTTNFVGITQGMSYIITVHEDAYYIGHTPYTSLSAAAEKVSGIKRDGWTFWKLPDGRTAKEAFGRPVTGDKL